MGPDYLTLSRPSRLKHLIRKLLLLPWFNRPLTQVLRLLPGMPWKHRLPVVGASTLLIDGPPFRQIEMLSADRCDVAKELYWGKGRLIAPADRLALDLATKLSANSVLFLDIGAYTGLFALAVARSAPNVHCDAYEIVPENFQLLWGNVIHNNLVQKVHPQLTGLGPQNSVLKVPATMGSGVLASSVALDAMSANGIEVPITTLDDRYSDFNGRMTLKIDVEGFEWPVFQGGAALIRRVMPDMVCEVLRRAPHVAEMQAFLLDCGYRILHITNGGLRPASAIVAVKHERDWLFTTRSDDELKGLGFPFASASTGVNH